MRTTEETAERAAKDYVHESLRHLFPTTQPEAIKELAWRLKAAFMTGFNKGALHGQTQALRKESK